MANDAPKEFSRAVENLIADFRELPDDKGRSKRRPTQDMAGLIDGLLLKYRIRKDSIEHEIRAEWAGLVGAANAAYSHPVVVERNLLVVLVSHAVVRNELFLHREAIVEKLRQIPGCSAIRGLALRAG